MQETGGLSGGAGVTLTGFTPVGMGVVEGGDGGLQQGGAFAFGGNAFAELHTRAITALVFGPTLPYPVVRGVPLQTMLFLHWKFLTAVCVSRPK